MFKSDSPASGNVKTNGQETEKKNGIFKCLISSISRLYPLTILIIFLHIAMFFQSHRLFGFGSHCSKFSVGRNTHKFGCRLLLQEVQFCLTFIKILQILICVTQLPAENYVKINLLSPIYF